MGRRTGRRGVFLRVMGEWVWGAVIVGSGIIGMGMFVFERASDI